MATTYTLRIVYLGNDSSANPASGVPSPTELTYQTAGDSPSSIYFQGVLSSAVPTRAAYNFAGWATSANGGVVYRAGASYSATYSDPQSTSYRRNLYAVWTSKVVTITYNANGGTFTDEGLPTTKTQSHAQAYSVTIENWVPVRTGYTFLGWNTDQSATEAEYLTGGTYPTSASTDLYNSTTIYAVWQAATYTIDFDANGGEGAPEAQTKTYGTPLTLSSTVPTKSGYNFAGWSTIQNAQTAEYQAGDTYSAEEGATLYAVWTVASVTLTLTYDANGGNGSPASETQTDDTTPIAFIVSSTVPTWTGHVFHGWSTTSSGSVEYTGGDSISISVNTTLYAIWSLEEYTITFHQADGTTTTMTKQYGVALTMPSNQVGKAGHTFLGWSTTEGSDLADYDVGENYTQNQAATFYGVWYANRYTITVDLDGGSGVTSPLTKIHDVPLTLPNAYKEGYVLDHWEDSNGNHYPVGGSYTANEATTLTAVWAEASFALGNVYVNPFSIPCDVYICKNGVLIPCDPIIYIE